MKNLLVASSSSFAMIVCYAFNHIGICLCVVSSDLHSYLLILILVLTSRTFLRYSARSRSQFRLLFSLISAYAGQNRICLLSSFSVLLSQLSHRYSSALYLGLFLKFILASYSSTLYLNIVLTLSNVSEKKYWFPFLISSLRADIFL